MARYNAWQNASLYGAAAGLDEAARRADRGAFFGSIHGTLSHLLWADLLWMSRLAGWDRPPGGIPESPALEPGWAALTRRRRAADEGIETWAAALGPAALEGDLAWQSRALGRDLTRPLWLCVTHMFNHQTHHRGQVHALLTAAGARPADTDLFAMPAGAGWPDGAQARAGDDSTE